MSVLSAQGLAVGHGGARVLAGIELTLSPGEVVCLLGANGAGKTTLFRTLLGLLPPRAGTVRLDGTDLRQIPRAEVARQLALVPQALTTPFAFTARDIVLMGAAAGLGAFARPGAAEARAADQALERLGIADLAAHPVTKLSGGQHQLVLIARALAQGAGTIVMDEPTASLDFANRLTVSRIIRRLASSGKSILFSTHDPDQAASLSDRAMCSATKLGGQNDKIRGPERPGPAMLLAHGFLAGAGQL